MQRRRFVRNAGAGLLTTLGMGLISTWQQAQAQTNALTIRALGHTCFQFTGDGRTLLVNPYKYIGCTANYLPQRVEPDLVMISSRLFDEGYLNEFPGLKDFPGEVVFLERPGTYDIRNLEGVLPALDKQGVYQFGSLRIEGFVAPHDREGGRRFGENLMWKWSQSGMTILHMGGAVTPIGVEEQILIGRPDILLIPVGGGPKAYNAQEAVQTVRQIRPKLVIPTHYRTAAASDGECDISGLDEFLGLMADTPVSRLNGDTATLRPENLPSEGTRIQIYSYQYA